MQSFSRVCVGIDFIVFNKWVWVWVFYDFFHMFICLLWFCHGLPKGEIVRTYVFHLLGTYVNILCNWLILWSNALYLYLDRSRMLLILQETRFQDQVLKSSSVSKKISWKFKFIKAWQLHLSSLRKLFQPSVLDTSYLSRFKKFKILIWFSWNPWMCLWAFSSPNPRQIKWFF